MRNPGQHFIALAARFVAVMTVLGSVCAQAAPGIFRQPTNQIATIGQTITFNVGATGAPPLTYQWRKETVNILRATNTTLFITNVEPNDAARYSVLVSEAGGASVLSSQAMLFVFVPVAIIDHPQSQTVVAGDSAQFSVTATGLPAPRYQWFGNGSVLPGATNQTLTISNAGPTQAGNYWVRVFSSAGPQHFSSQDSDPAMLNVVEPPRITMHPQDISVIFGSNASLRVMALGTEPLKYHWQFNGMPLGPGVAANLGDLMIPDARPEHEGSYSVVVSNAYGIAASDPALLTVLKPARVAQGPQSQIVSIGDTATFTVQAEGTEPIQYQWLFKGSPLPNAIGSTLSIAGVKWSDRGEYRVLVTNAYGGEFSPPAFLDVQGPPTITSQPTNQAVPVNAPAQFFAAVIGTEPIAYQWFFNGLHLAGATMPQFLLPNAQWNDRGNYRLVASNAFGMATSDVAHLEILMAPVITSQPLSKSVLRGSTLTLNVAAFGTAPLAYYWNFNGTPLTDGTLNQSGLTLPNMQTSNAGNYQVVVSNQFGVAASAIAAITVVRPPEINSQPQSRTVPQGSSVVFVVSASGDEPLRYQWYFGTNPIANATSPMLTIGAAQLANQGQYRVAISNQYGSVLSAPAQLIVEIPAAPPSIANQPQSQSVMRGSSVSMSVTANGAAPLSYQWYFNGATIPSGTNSGAVLNNVQTNDAGGYLVVVANPYGVTTSQLAHLQVTVPDLLPLPFVDHFSNSVAIVGASFLAGTGSNISATLERPDEPQHEGVSAGRSVWLSWTAPSNGIVTINTYGSDFDTVLAVYTNDTLATLKRVAGDDDSGNDVGAIHSSEVLFNAVAGVTYRIAVAGHWFTEGNFNFQLRLKPSAFRLPTFLAELNSFAVREGDDAFLNIAYDADEPVQIDWIFDDMILPTSANLTFNNISNVRENAVGRYRVVITTLTATNYSRWGEIQINSSGRTNVLARDKLGDATNSGHYLNLAGSSPNGGPKKGSAPKFGSGAHGFSGTQIFSTSGATSDPGEPNHCGISAGRSEWFAYQAETNGTLSIDTDGSSFNTVLAVYIGPGDSYSTLTNVACDDNSGSNGLTSKVIFQATQGTIYWIAVDGRTNATPTTGTVKLHMNLGNPVSIGAQPQSQTVPAGTNVNFTIDANGMTNYTFQWRFFGTNLPGATGSNYLRASVNNSHVGPYDVVVRNPINSVTSSVATLTIAGTLSITNQPQSLTVLAGSNVSFSVGASGVGTLAYQWRFNGTNLVGATNGTLPLLNVQLPNAGTYAVNVTDANGSQLSSNATLTVQISPVITLQPVGHSTATGALAILTAGATGIPVPWYQWFFNGMPISGANASTLNIANFQPSNSGVYRMTASNFLGVAQTVEAELFANTPLRFTNLVCSNGTMSARLIGVANTNYVIQWSTNNSTWISKATNSSSSGIWIFNDSWTNWTMRTYRARTQ